MTANTLYQHITDKLSGINVFALDMDGTIYLGQELFPFTKNFLDGLTKAGKRYVFLTNNSSKNADDYLVKLHRMGLEVEKSQIYTSGDATIEYLIGLKPNARIFLMGTKNLCDDFERAGFVLTDDRPDFVVLGFDTDFTYEKFDKGARFLRQGIPFIASHPDYNCPLPNNDMIPDCGALSAAFTAATGVEPKVIGKPNREMLDGVLKRMGATKNELGVMGDRLMTDIRMGNDFGIFSILVLTGEAKRDDLVNSVSIPDLIIERNIDLLDYF